MINSFTIENFKSYKKAELKLAQKFVAQVKLALNNQTPYKPLKFPTKEELLNLIDDFPNKASQGLGFGDFSIIKDWEEHYKKFPGW